MLLQHVIVGGETSYMRHVSSLLPHSGTTVGGQRHVSAAATILHVAWRFFAAAELSIHRFQQLLCGCIGQPHTRMHASSSDQNPSSTTHFSPELGLFFSMLLLLREDRPPFVANQLHARLARDDARHSE